MKAYVLKSAALLMLAVLLSQCEHNANSQSQEKKGRGSIYETRVELDPLPPADVKVSGEYMRAFSVAYEAFRNDADIPEQKRNIENYQIEFRQKDEAYLVLFIAKHLPSESEWRGGESELGRTVLYWMRKGDYQLLGRNFFK